MTIEMNFNDIPNHVFDKLITCAEKSTMRTRHGCVITKGKNIMYSGTNDEIYHSECKAILQCVLWKFC